jgi:hypothetical protein
VKLSVNHGELLCHFFIDIMSCLFNWPQFPRSQLRMTFVEALGPILARGPDPIIVRRDLEGRGPSASNHQSQVSQQFDRDRVASFGHASIYHRSSLSLTATSMACAADFKMMQLSYGTPKDNPTVP